MHIVPLPADCDRYTVSPDRIEPGLHLRFTDARGRCLLALFRRPGPDPDRPDMLVVNAQRPDRSWGAEIEIGLPRHCDGARLELAAGPWRVEIRCRGDVLLRFNPVRAFGAGFALTTAAALESSCPPARLALGSRLNARWLWQVAAAAPVPPVPAPTAGLLVIGAGPVPDAATGFDRVELVAQDEAQVNAALAVLDCGYVVAVSGDDEGLIAQAGKMLRQVRAAGRADVFLPVCADLDFRFGRRWAVALPGLVRGRTALCAVAGRLLVDPELVSAGRWLIPDAAHAPRTRGLRAVSARLPLTPGGAVRPAPQLCLIGPGPDDTLPFSGLCRRPAGLARPHDLQTLTASLLDIAATECASHIILSGPVAPAPDALRDWIAAMLDDEAHALTDEDGSVLALSLPVPVLAALRAPRAGAGLAVAERRVFDTLPPLFAALAETLRAAGVPVLPGGLPAPLARPLPDPDTTAPAWVMPAEETRVLLTRLGGGGDGALAGLDADWTRRILLSGLGTGQGPAVAEAACRIETERPELGALAGLADLVRKYGPSLDPDTLATLTDALADRGLESAMLTALDDLLRAGGHGADPVLMALALKHGLGGPDLTPAALGARWNLPEPLPPALQDALSDALLLQRDWAGVLTLYDRAAAPGPGLIRAWLTARLELGDLDGLDKALAAVRGRLDGWSHRRLGLRLARAASGLEQAIDALVEAEPELAPLVAPPTGFHHVSGPARALAPGQIGCIIVARNEFLRLKWLVAEYQRLGVDHVFLIDNLSEDETLAHFAQVPDVTVLQTGESYNASRYGVKWHNEVADRYLQDCWVLTVDADELLVFDRGEADGALKALCARLDREGAEGLFTTMIDMYAAAPLDTVAYRPGQPLTDTFDRFDATGYRVAPVAGCPDRAVWGGARARLFWDQAEGIPPPALQKVPLVKWHRGFRYLSSTHEATPLHLSDETGALLHFKFLPDFHDRARDEAARGQHYDGAREYRVYADRLAAGLAGFTCDRTMHYDDSTTLVRLGLIQPSQNVKA